MLDGVADVPVWSLTLQEQASGIVDLPRRIAAAHELWLRVLAASDRSDVASLCAATSTVAWLAHATVCPPGAAKADIELAAALDGTCAATERRWLLGDRPGPGSGDRPCGRDPADGFGRRGAGSPGPR